MFKIKCLSRIGALIATLLVLSLGIVSTSNAMVIVDEINLDQYVPWFGSYSYTHNINDQGFVLGSAISGSLAIDIWDDRSDFFDFIPEVLVVVVENFDFDTGGLAFGSFFNNLEIEGLLALNQDGYLDVKVQSILGDFKIHKSTLTVETRDVPEPAPMALLGLGLMGLLYSRTRLSK